MLNIENFKIIKAENRVNGVQPAILLHNEQNNHLYMVTISADYQFNITDEGVVGERYDLNFNYVKKSKSIKSWEHYAKSWFGVDYEFAIKKMNENLIVKCILEDMDYLFNIPNKNNPDIETDMMNNGRWYIYTFAN
ncbi:MAG: hypothetical protein K0R54_185 [Clostridiaceae bacterium]|jgi:hypothetical protein|nr:hypothetical protein [Clostridiaceae bacterium]